jgi:hypothetical protein
MKLPRPTPKLLGHLLLAIVLLTSLGVPVTLAGGGQGSDASTPETTTVSDADLTIGGANAVVEDVHLDDTGLEERRIDERTYGIENWTATVDGLSFSFEGHEYRVDDLTVRIEELSLTVRNVTVA